MSKYQSRFIVGEFLRISPKYCKKNLLHTGICVVRKVHKPSRFYQKYFSWLVKSTYLVELGGRVGGRIEVKEKYLEPHDATSKKFKNKF